MNDVIVIIIIIIIIVSVVMLMVIIINMTLMNLNKRLPWSNNYTALPKKLFVIQVYAGWRKQTPLVPGKFLN